MTILVPSSNSLNPKIIPETSKDSPRILPTASTSTSWMFSFHGSKDDQDEATKNIRRKKETNADRKKVKEEKGKRYFRMVFPVKKMMTCVVSGVFSRIKTPAGENREGDSAQETTETLAVGRAKLKQNPTEKVSFWKSARVGLKILILGEKLKMRRRRRRRSSSESMGEAELCKKRILMGERCKPMNRSGVLQYDGDGILLPEP